VSPLPTKISAYAFPLVGEGVTQISKVKEPPKAAPLLPRNLFGAEKKKAFPLASVHAIKPPGFPPLL
jgi:hypothetical protein